MDVLRMLNPKLGTLLTAAELGSFTRAAAALNFTQPAVSHHISQLERQLGVTLTLLALLVNRKAKGVTFFRMIYFSPQVVTMTVVTVIWGFFFSSTADGLFNSILRVFGVPAQKWLQDTTLAMPSIAMA